MRLFYLKYLPVFFCLMIFGNAFSQDLVPSQHPHLSGYWKFQNPNAPTKATVGKDLILVGTHQSIAGPERKDTAVRIGIGSYYKCHHGALPNGGDSVNRYTLMFDFRVDNLNRWHTFFQTDTNNLNDGECFIRPNSQSNPGRIGTAATGYTPVAINPKQWYRLVISVNLGSYYRYYLNGQLILDGNNQDTDDRFALNPHLLLFADNDQEDDTIDIASVAFFDTCLNNTQVAALGTVDPCILHPMSLNLGKDTMLCGNASLTKQLIKGYTYKWSTGDTASAVTFNVGKMGLGSKTISVEMKDINACIKRDTFVLSIFTSPSVNLGRDTGFCKGPSYRILAGPAGGNTYEWKHLPSGNIVSKINSMTTDSSGLYTVKMTNSNQCSAFDTVQISVYPVPAKPNFSYNAKELCEYDTFFITGPSNFAAYQWSDGHTTRNFAKTTSGSLKLKVQTSYGCSSEWSDSVVFKYNPLPSKPMILFLPDTSICSGDSTLFYVSGNYNSISWNDGYNKFNRYVKTAGTYKARIRDLNNCLSGWSDQLICHILSKPDKPEIISPNGLKFCEGDTATLICNSNSDSVIWSNNETQTHIKIHSSGLYSVKSINYNGCSNELQDSIAITFYPKPPKPQFTFNIPTFLLSSVINADKYEWYFDSVKLSDTARSVLVKNVGTYSLRIKIGSCWSEKADTFMNIIVSVPDFRNSNFRIYPNPIDNNGILHIDKSVDFNPDNLFLYSTDGRRILYLNYIPDTIDLSELPAGQYTLIIQGPKDRYTASIIKL